MKYRVSFGLIQCVMQFAQGVDTPYTKKHVDFWAHVRVRRVRCPRMTTRRPREVFQHGAALWP